MKVIICTARYSDNLGDGVISDSVAYLVNGGKSSIEVFHLDISGRLGYDESVSCEKPLSKKLFHLSPGFFRPFITLFGWFFIFKKRIIREIQRIKFSEADLLIFGGGQLVSDIGLNFPLKISFICRIAQKSSLSYGFNAVGVAKDFSFLAKRLFKNVFDSDSCRFISVRDQGSLNNLGLLTSRTDVGFTVDSGLWAPEAYGLPLLEKESLCKPLTIGIGVSDPAELASHVVNGHQNTFDYLSFWSELIQHVLSAGYQPVVFTNGSRDDYNFLIKLKAFLQSQDLLDKVQFTERFVYPKQLVTFISSLDGVLSHRLHANIIAHSFLIPAVALAWDQKVKAYYELIERPHWCVSDQLPAKEIASVLFSAFEEKIEREKIDQLRSRSKEMLAKQLKEYTR